MNPVKMKQLYKSMPHADRCGAMKRKKSPESNKQWRVKRWLQFDGAELKTLSPVRRDVNVSKGAES
jgi:hypothetical protein